MECKITITGTFSEIQEALFMLTDGAHVDHVKTMFNPVPLDLQREETKSNGAKLNPDQDCAGKTPSPDPSPEMGGETGLALNEKVKEAHCHTCGRLFVRANNRQKHCSKKCRQIEYREKNREFIRKYDREWQRRKNAIPEVRIDEPVQGKTATDANKVVPDAKKVAPNAKKTTKSVDVEEFNRKMKEIRDSHPKPTERPVIHREY